MFEKEGVDLKTHNIGKGLYILEYQELFTNHSR